MRWILIIPLVVACDRVRPPANAERPVAPAPTVTLAGAPDTAAPVVTPPPSAPESTVVTAPDSVIAVVPDSAVLSKPESVVVRPRALVIPASLSRLPPAPENEPLEFDAERGPVLPQVSYGDCEGDRCSSAFVALSCVATDLRSTASPDAPVAARLPEGELVQVRRDLHMVEAGVVILKKDFALEWDETANAEVARADTVHFAEGDTVFVLRYLERGRWTWAYLGRLHDSGEFWATTTRAGAKRAESELAVRRSLPRREHWWNVTRLDGTSGWWLQAVSGEREDTEAHDELQQVSGVRNDAGVCGKVKSRAARIRG